MGNYVKRILAIILSIALVITGCYIMPMESKAADAEVSVSGVSGDVRWWLSTDKTTLTFSGQGEMDDYYTYKGLTRPWNRGVDDDPLDKYITSIVVEDGITNVGRLAFGKWDGKLDKLQSVQLPSTLKRVGAHAFRNAVSLTEIVIPEGTIAIEDGAFYGCESLTTISLPKSLKNIDESAFNGAEALTTINYAGTKEEWEDIYISDAVSGNDVINKATINCAATVQVTAYDDISDTDAWVAGIQYLAQYGYMHAESATTFGVNQNLKRVEVLNALYKKAGYPGNYASAYEWAAANGIISEKVTENIETLTGNQLYNILYNTALYNGHEAEEISSVLSDLEKTDVVLTRGQAATALQDYFQSMVSTANRYNQQIAEIKTVLTKTGGDGRMYVVTPDLSTGTSEQVGDCTFIIFPNGKTMLIDGGYSSVESALKKFISDIGLVRLDYMVLSHPHNDHYGNLSAVISALHGEVEEYWDSGLALKENSWTFTGLMSNLTIRSITKRRDLRAGTTIQVGDVTIEFFNPTQEEYDAVDELDEGNQTNPVVNNVSLGMRFTYGDSSYLTVGDIYSNQEEVLVAKYGSKLQADIVKANHHGHYTSNSNLWLDTVAPKIMVADNTDIGDSHLLERANQRNINYLSNGVDGLITISFGNDAQYELTTQYDTWTQTNYRGTVRKREIVQYVDEISEYREGTFSAPTPKSGDGTEFKGYLFAGWFQDQACTNALDSTTASEGAYAKFVPEEILDVKAQISSGLIDKDATNDSEGAIRFVTTVDSLRYSEVGFKIAIDGQDQGKKSSAKVYTTLYTVGAIDKKVCEVKPTDICELSRYFKTWTYTNVPASYYDSVFTITPFWITLDGTVVEGKAVEKTVENGIDANWIWEAELSGVYYQTLQEALTTAGDGDTIALVNDVTIQQQMVIDKSITITTDTKSRTIRCANATANAHVIKIAAGSEAVVTLQGSSESAQLVFDGDGTTFEGVFIQASTECASQISLQNVTMKNISTKFGYGVAVGIVVPSTLRNCQFISCNGTRGGAVYTEKAIEIDNCKFYDCTASTAGGALYSKGVANIQDSVFSGNQTNIRGGAIFTNQQLTISGCTFGDDSYGGNTATTDGGAIYVEGNNTLKITDTSFRNNRASSYGGAIAMGNGSATLTLLGYCPFERNSAAGGTTTSNEVEYTHAGGAIMAPAKLNIGDGITVTMVVMTQNECTGYEYGDAISINADSYTNFKVNPQAGLCIYDNPTVGDLNADICCRNGVSVDTTSYERIYSQAPEARIGNAYYATLEKAIVGAKDGDTLTLVNNVTLDKQITIDKGITITTDGTPRTIYCAWETEDNSKHLITVKAWDKEVKFEGKSEDAPLIFEKAKNVNLGSSIIYSVIDKDTQQSTKKLTFENVTMQNIKINANYTGAIRVGVQLEINSCTFANCSQKSEGGAIYSSGKLDVKNSKFQACQSESERGGAIHCTGELDVKNSEFQACQSMATANDKGGGAIYSSGKLEVTNSKFVECTSKSRGGAIHCTKTLNVTGSEFQKCKSNSTGGAGGAVYIADKNTVTIKDCIFKSNTVETKGFGGAIGFATDTSTLNLIGQCTFKENAATGRTDHTGGAILAPMNFNIGDGTTYTMIVMTQNEYTGSDYGDAISINATSAEGFVVKANAGLCVYDNPTSDDTHPDICLKNGTSVNITNSPGIYTHAPEARIGNTYYGTLEKAIEGAKDGDTITLVNNVTLDKQIEIKNSITITTDGTARTIYCAWETTDRLKHLITVSEAKDVKFVGTSAAPLIFDKTDNVKLGSSIIYSTQTGENSKLTLQYITMQNIVINAKYTGALRVGVPLVIDNCTFEKCSQNGQGGAIYCSGKLDVTNSTFKECQGADGGAIYIANQNTITINNSTFKSNTAKSGFGGAIGVGTQSSTLNLIGHCTFEGNTATGKEEDNNEHAGGAIRAPKYFNIGDGTTDTIIVMTQNECTGYDYGDAISINATSAEGFKVKDNASLYMYDNPTSGDTHSDICLQNGVTVNTTAYSGIYTQSPEE